MTTKAIQLDVMLDMEHQMLQGNITLHMESLYEGKLVTVNLDVGSNV